MSKLKKISNKIGLTVTETKIIFFLVVVFFIGLFSYYLIYETDAVKPKSFSYKNADSIFISANNKVKIKSSFKNDVKKVDSKQELLDFSANNISRKDNYKIDINKASIKDFQKLPGIGIKTAKKIIELRKAKGSFKKVKDLLMVKGIGKFKFKKIKNFIFIEN